MATLLITCAGPLGLADLLALHLESVGAATTYVAPIDQGADADWVQHLMATATAETFDRAVHNMLTSHPSVLITSVDLDGTLFVSVTADRVAADR